jgi:hypothetical protein
VKADAKPRKYSDGGGLYLFVPTNGSKLWRQAYSFGGKQRVSSHGAYPAVSLAAARKARDAAKELLAQGVDPGRQKRIEKIRAADAPENSHHLWPAGSFIGDPHTPVGIRNSSQKRIGSFEFRIFTKQACLSAYVP